MNSLPLRPVLRHACLRAGAAAVLLASGLARAQALPPATADAVTRGLALAVEAAQALAPRGARVQALPGTLDQRLTLAPCARVEPYLPAGVPAWGRTRLGLRCNDGVGRWNVLLPLTLQVWAPGLVAAGALPAGARLSASQLVLGEIDWAAAGGTAFASAEPLAGRTLLRPLLAGQALRAGDLQARLWFARGDLVHIQAGGSGFSISAEGEALAPGLDGQPVRVRTEGGRVLVGRAVGEHRVEVDL